GRRRTRVREERVNVRGGRRPLRELRDELWTRDEVSEVSLLVRLQLRLPVALTDDDAVAYLPLVAKEDGVARHVVGEAEGRLVCAYDQEARLLELYREEERLRDVDPLRLTARRVIPATLYLVRPEVLARLVGLTIEEVVVVRADERARIVYRVRARLRCVVNDSERRSRGRAERRARRRVL